MFARSARPLLVPVLLLAAAFLLFPGCDTSDPTPPAAPQDVAGVYDITLYRFTPQAQAITPADVLTRLNREETFLELLATTRGGQFQLRYRLVDELFDIINGDFSVNANTVSLVVREEDRPSLTRLLLDPQISLRREDENTLIRRVTKTVNLEAYDPEQYGGAGLTRVQGTLEIHFQRRTR